jgi:excisionase family DNA binding protein
MTQQLYSTHEISRLLQVDPSSVSKWIDRGILLAFRTPGGHRRVRGSDLRNFLVEHHMPIPDELGTGRIRLVVVDDERAVLDALKRSLRPYANQVELITTESGIEAVLMVNEYKPDGLLIDLNLPDLDGLEVCRRVSSRKPLEGVLLVTMTGRATPQTLSDSLRAGAVACLSKPLDLRQVLRLFQVTEQPLQEAAS